MDRLPSGPVDWEGQGAWAEAQGGSRETGGRGGGISMQEDTSPAATGAAGVLVVPVTDGIGLCFWTYQDGERVSLSEECTLEAQMRFLTSGFGEAGVNSYAV